MESEQHVCSELLDSNAKVAVVDMSEEALQKLQEKFGSPENMKCYQLDVTKVDDITATVKKIREEMGEIEDACSGSRVDERAEDRFDMQPEEWDLMFQINAKGLFFMMQQVVSQSMTKTGGSIVNFSSMAGIRGMRAAMASPHYSASKGAVAAMSRQAATEWAKYQVRCNAIAPGGVMTEAMKKMEFPEETMDPIPLRRLSEPKDIANTVVFLASEQAGMITGQTIVIDGGSSIVGY